MFKIEKGVPLPPQERGRGAISKYPFAEMEVGDSFSLPLTGEKGTGGSTYYKWDKSTRKLTNASIHHARRHGKKFTVREMKEEGVARCWRVS
jgi:hypothetical protein